MFKVKEKWKSKYQNAMNRWEENWEVLTSMFKFSAEVRKVIYITNAIERLSRIPSKYTLFHISSVHNMYEVMNTRFFYGVFYNAPCKMDTFNCLNPNL